MSSTEQDSLLEGIPQPPAGPSKSFSIDFKIPLKVEVEDNFESLRDAHADFFDTFLSSGTEPDLSQSNAAAHSIDSTATDIDSDSFPNLHTRPSFNLASAESLFTSFQSMLCHFPCIVLPPDASVSLLATTQPFLLLAILAATSGSRTLQGNSLYEEEFRKVLGLKFVAGGERTVEMLQAILIFCAWYASMMVLSQYGRIDKENIDKKASGILSICGQGPSMPFDISALPLRLSMT